MKFPGSEHVRYIMLFDGNVPYFGAKHIPLFIAGCILATLSLGFTMTLLFIQPLQKYSHWRCLQWVNKFKPLFDAYTCPHIIKPRCRFWNGLLLLVRTVLYISFITEYKSVLVSITVMCMLIQTTVWAVGGVYTKRHLNFLSSSYILNAGFLSAITMYDLSRERSDANYSSITSTVFCVSIKVVTVTMVGTILYHILLQLKCLKNCFQWLIF